MLKIHSFLLGIKQRIKKVTKDCYKSCFMVTAYALVAIIIILCSDNFYDKGDCILEAYAKTDSESNTFEQSEETDTTAQIRTDNLTTLQTKEISEGKDTVINLSTEAQENTNVDNTGTFGWVMLVTVSDISDIEQYAAEAASTDTTVIEQKAIAIEKEEEIAKAKEEAKVKAKKEAIAKEKALAKQKAKQKALAEKKAKATRKIAVINISSSDKKVLQRIVEAEATGEDIKGKMLVASVILNRVKSRMFPNTVEKVVFQRNGSTVQFSPTKDGRYWSVTVTKETKIAVDRVLAGEDYSHGALFFSARSRADKNSMSWFDRNLKRLFKYGGHEFYTVK